MLGIKPTSNEFTFNSLRKTSYCAVVDIRNLQKYTSVRAFVSCRRVSQQLLTSSVCFNEMVFLFVFSTICLTECLILVVTLQPNAILDSKRYICTSLLVSLLVAIGIISLTGANRGSFAAHLWHGPFVVTHLA